MKHKFHLVTEKTTGEQIKRKFHLATEKSTREQMKTVSLLVPESAVTASVADPYYLFSTVNTLLKQPSFRVQLIGLTYTVRMHHFSITADTLLQDAAKPDLIIIPALNGPIKDALQQNARFIPWIVEQYNNGAEVASLCTGAFLLAQTGLLDGKMSSTHWQFAGEFKQLFPEVELVDDRIITDQHGLYSSGGANSYWNLLLYLVEKYTDRNTAILVSKYFLVDMGKDNLSAFIIFRGRKDHADELVKKAQAYIEQYYKEKITVEQLADMLEIGRRSLERRFKKATSSTLVEYIQRVKVEATKAQLEAGSHSVQEAMLEVGYTDVKAFRDVFRRFTGMSPIDYRNKYNKP